MKRLLSVFKKKMHHVIMILVLFFLALLLGWWSIFIKKSIIQAYRDQNTIIEQTCQILASKLGKLPDRPVPGIYRGDDRLVISIDPDPQGLTTLKPNWPQYSIHPNQAYLNRIALQKKRQSLMVLGEGSFLAICVIISSFMLYYNIRLERRSKEELVEFWSRVTHEIKTPITGIRLFLETLKRGTLKPDEQSYLVDMAMKQIARQQQLTQNILMGQQVERRAGKMTLVSLNPVEFLEKYINHHNLMLAGVKTEIIADQKARDVRVKADPNSLHTILDNLADNAIKYGPSDLSLVFHFEVTKKVILSVTDNGPGFPPKMADHLFDAYRRLPRDLPVGKHGTGMGLHICRSLARAMGGDMEAFSHGEGEGATFKIFMIKE
ncbi:MAG: hypothetical protein CR997_05215 [Acidobacteria bacterium]|nr:MAG: hypothetical protein CR997_05215 [Acidobacteriota bacterium]